MNLYYFKIESDTSEVFDLKNNKMVYETLGNSQASNAFILRMVSSNLQEMNMDEEMDWIKLNSEYYLVYPMKLIESVENRKEIYIPLFRLIGRLIISNI